MDRVVLVPGQTTGGVGACAHVVTISTASGLQCVRCHVLLSPRAA